MYGGRCTHSNRCKRPSHDRPSAIQNAKHLPTSPREALLDMGTHNLPEYASRLNSLSLLLGTANALQEAAKDDCYGPLSPTQTLLRDLSRWQEDLPSHLSVAAVEAMPMVFQRPLILLHVQYHYTISLITRSALLSRCTLLSKRRQPTHASVVSTMADRCVVSGRSSSQLLIKLDALGLFNAVTWLDVYYLYSSTLVLVLSLICDASQGNMDTSENALSLLQHCTQIASRHIACPRVPSTMQRWLTVVRELEAMVRDFVDEHDTSKRLSRQQASQNDRTLAYPESPLNTQSHGRSSDINAANLERPISEVSSSHTREEIALVDMSGFDNDSTGIVAGPMECYAWQDMFWEDISDMLLREDTRSFTF